MWGQSPGPVYVRPPVRCSFHGCATILQVQLQRGIRVHFLRLALVILSVSCVAAQNVVHYTTTNANVKYLFATADPVLHLKPGDILDTNTLDCFGNGLKKPGDTLDMAKGDNPLAGPFFIDGAEAGDTLAVKILDLQVDGDYGVGAFSPGFGSINSAKYTQVLEVFSWKEWEWVC